MYQHPLLMYYSADVVLRTWKLFALFTSR